MAAAEAVTQDTAMAADAAAMEEDTEDTDAAAGTDTDAAADINAAR